MIKIVIDEVSEPHPGAYRTKINPSDVRMIGLCDNLSEEQTLIFIKNSVYNQVKKTLQFLPMETEVLRIGEKEDALLLDIQLFQKYLDTPAMADKSIPFLGEMFPPKPYKEEKGVSKTANKKAPKINASINSIVNNAGDKKFLNNLPDYLYPLGSKFLNGIRNQYRGHLEYKPISSKYVERPDNFWTVKIQPRDCSLRVTVRGRPESFPTRLIKRLEIKNDMGSYSNFKVMSEDHLKEAIEVIKISARTRKVRY